MPEPDLVESFHDFVLCEYCGKMVSNDYFNYNLNLCQECLDKLNDSNITIDI